MNRTSLCTFILVSQIVVAITTVVTCRPFGVWAAEVSQASSTAEGSDSAGPRDGDRFSTDQNHLWKGETGAERWWWQIEFDEPCDIGAILQVAGDGGDVLNNAPRNSVWQISHNGQSWQNLCETRVVDERRSFRIHRLTKPVTTRFLRLLIDSAIGAAPALREVEIFAAPDAAIEFPLWVVAVSTTEATEGPGGLGAGREFLPLVRSCPGWEQTPAQFVWMGHFDLPFLEVEPRPLCAFLSGNFKDWCEKDRAPWRGIEAVLRDGQLPLWAACGGAQGLAILAEVGTDQPWDCPFCRDPQNPKSPIYGHIEHLKPGKCGDYTNCVFERGKYLVRQRLKDPAFAGLPRDFEIMESHCGQIEYVPAGWVHVIENGPGGRTKMQCLRLKDRPVYAAQFHIEMAGTPENSRQIMANFLRVAEGWVRDQEAGLPLPEPQEFEE